MERLCDDFNRLWQEEAVEPLLLIPAFVLDFLCIHPFRDGNGRMARLLTLLRCTKRATRSAATSAWSESSRSRKSRTTTP